MKYGREAVMVVHEDGALVSTGRGPNLLGFPHSFGHTGRHLAEYVHPDDLFMVLELLEQMRKGPANARVRLRARMYDGTWTVLVADVEDARHHPVIKGVVIRIHRDDHAPVDPITGEIGAEVDEIGSSGFSSLVEAMSIGILSADLRGRVVYANDAATELFRTSREDLMGGKWLEAVHDHDRDEVAATAILSIEVSGHQEVTFRVQVRDHLRWVHARFTALRRGDEISGWVASFEDVTALREAHDRLSHLATHDPLTSLPNRAFFDEQLGEALERLRRLGLPVGILYVDVDRLKPVNDTYGHEAGDQVLVAVADQLRSAIRTGDVAARVGGDEFMVVAEGVDRVGAVALADRIMELLHASEGEGGPRLSACIGVATTSDPHESAQDLVNRADQAMYRAKRAGRNRVEVATEPRGHLLSAAQHPPRAPNDGEADGNGNGEGGGKSGPEDINDAVISD